MDKKLTKIYVDFHNKLTKYIISQPNRKDYELNKDVTLNFVILLRMCYGDNAIYQVISILGFLTTSIVKEKKIEVAIKSKEPTSSYIG